MQPAAAGSGVVLDVRHFGGVVLIAGDICGDDNAQSQTMYTGFELLLSARDGHNECRF